MTIYNPLDKFYKSITGAVPYDEPVIFRVKGNFDSVVFILKSDKNGEFFYKDMEKRDGYFETTVKPETGLYFYCFKTFDKYIVKGEKLQGVLSIKEDFYQLTVYKKDYKVPEWLKGGIIYQIFPDRFCDSGEKKNTTRFIHADKSENPYYKPNENGQVLNNDFFGGDIKGIISKLSYLSGLGITAIYLNPIFKAYSNHRYDTGDYFAIDELLGTDEDFRNLISSAEAYGIKIILDGVFNHTGDDSVYFNKYGNYGKGGAYNDKNSPYYGWYKFTDYPDKYESWWGVKTLPATDKNSSSFIDFITGANGVIERYTKMKIGGWRLDVVDELPSEFVKRIRSAVKRVDDNAIIIGEVWEDASNKISYGVRREYFQGKELDSVMNYPLKNAIIDFVRCKNADNLYKTVIEQIDHYPKAVLDSLMNMLSTHDTFRILSAIEYDYSSDLDKDGMSTYLMSEKNRVQAVKLLKIATLLQFTLYGVPTIYYGDEAGMEGLTDPFNRRFFPWEKEDKEILSWYKKLSLIRRSYDAFVNGEVEILYAKSGVFSFIRKGKESEVLVAVNLNQSVCYLSFSEKLKNLIDGKTYEKISFEENGLGVFIKTIKTLD